MGMRIMCHALAKHRNKTYTEWLEKGQDWRFYELCKSLEKTEHLMAEFEGLSEKQLRLIQVIYEDLGLSDACEVIRNMIALGIYDQKPYLHPNIPF